MHPSQFLFGSWVTWPAGGMEGGLKRALWLRKFSVNILDDEIIVFSETRTLHMFAWRSTEISATPENYIEKLYVNIVI